MHGVKVREHGRVSRQTKPDWAIRESFVSRDYHLIRRWASNRHKSCLYGSINSIFDLSKASMSLLVLLAV